MMRRLTVMLVLIALTMTGATAVSSSATATTGSGSYVSLTLKDATAWAGSCARLRYSLTVTDDPFWWSVELTVRGPDGRTKAWRLWDQGDVGLDGSLRLCREKQAGVYTATAHYTGTLSPYPEETVEAQAEFTVRPKQNTRLKVTKDPYGSTGWKFTGTLTRAGKPFYLQKVQLWYREYGTWLQLNRLTKITNRRGKCHWHTERNIPKNRYAFQLRYKGDKTTKLARSDVFRLQPR